MTALGARIKGRQLEDCPVVVSAAHEGRAVEIAGGIEDQAGRGGIPVRAVVVEAIQHPLRPESSPFAGQLEDRPTVVSAACGRCAVEIARSIEDQTGRGITAIRTIGLRAEVVQHRFCPTSTPVGRQLECISCAVSAASFSHAVEIAGGVDDQAGLWVDPVRATAEAVQQLLRPTSTFVENSPGSTSFTVTTSGSQNEIVMIASFWAPGPYSLSGTISGSLSGATIYAYVSSVLYGTAVSDGSGNYSITGLYNATYTVTPLKSCITFTPSYTSITISGGNSTGNNFAQVTGPCFVQGNTAFTGGNTSLTVSTTGSTTAGNALILTTTSATPSGVSGCGTWNLLTSSTGNLLVYYAMNIPGGACTVTVTYGTSRGYDLTLSEYSGLSTTYIPEVYQYTGVIGSPISTTVGTFGASDLLLSVVFDTNANDALINSSFQFTQRLVVHNTASTNAVFTFDATASPGFYTNVATGIYASGYTQVLMAFRSVLPSVGRLQWSNFTTSTSQAYPFNNLSGSTLIALLECAGTVKGTMAVPTDTQGNTWIMSPVRLNSDSSNEYWVAYALNAAAGANTVTEGTGGSTCTSGGMQLFEYRGINSVSPLAGSSTQTLFFTGSSGDTGPVTVGAQTVIFGAAASMNNNGVTMTIPQSWIPFAYDTTDSITPFDQIVGAGTYHNPFTVSNASGFPASFILALSTTAISYPVLMQHAENGLDNTDGSFTVPLSSPIVAGELILVPFAKVTGSAYTISDNQSNTYNSLQPGLYYTIAKSSGSLTVSISSANVMGVLEFANTSGALLDQSNTATATGTSVGTGNITTTANNELLFSMVSDVNDPSNRTFYSGQGSTWSGTGLIAGGHNSGIFGGWKTQQAINTYSNTFTWNASTTLIGDIASFKFVTSTPYMFPVVY